MSRIDCIQSGSAVPRGARIADLHIRRYGHLLPRIAALLHPAEEITVLPQVVGRYDSTTDDSVRLSSEKASHAGFGSGIRGHEEDDRVIFRSNAGLHRSVKDHKEVVSPMKTKNARKIEKLIGKHMKRGENVIKNRIRRQREDR